MNGSPAAPLSRQEKKKRKRDAERLQRKLLASNARISTDERNASDVRSSSDGRTASDVHSADSVACCNDVRSACDVHSKLT